MAVVLVTSKGNKIGGEIKIDLAHYATNNIKGFLIIALIGIIRRKKKFREKGNIESSEMSRSERKNTFYNKMQ